MNKAAFLDRDGVINRKAPQGQYVTRWEQVEFLPGAAPAIRLLHEAGFLVILVSNQRCVARGIVQAAEVEALHERMRAHLAAAGAIIDAIYYCPHDTQPACACRKPAPGMLLAAARAHDLDLGESWMIGDSDADVEAGKRAGCHTVRLLTSGELDTTGADVSAASLPDAVQQIVRTA